MSIDFSDALLVLGLLLVVTAGLSGWLHGTVLSISVLSLGAGIALSLAGVVDVDPASEVVLFTVELALILTLFADGLQVERELIQEEWRPPVLALAVAMPVTLVLLALAAKALFHELTWAEAFLLGAVLSPTDPVVTSTVVTSRDVPAQIRHILNLESGLNDGLALPFVLFFLALAAHEGGIGGEALSQVGETVVGALVGIVAGVAGSGLLRWLPGGGITAKYEGVYALGIALAAFGVAEASHGNGLIATFVAGVLLAVGRREIPEAFTDFNESASAAFQVITFVLFGALVAETSWDGDTVALVAFIAFALLVARPAAVLLSFAGIPMALPSKLFIAWFGPKGVASMLFALLVLSSSVDRKALVFDVAAFTVISSIFAHGLTDTVGSRWVARRLDATPRAQDAQP